MSDTDHLRFWRLLDELCRERGTSTADLTAALAEAGHQVTPQYLSALRSGKKDNPNYKLLHALGQVLGVHPAWFVGGRRDRAHGSVTSDGFTARLRRLFESIRPAGGNPYSIREIVSRVPECTAALPGRGWTLSAPTLADLCKGDNDNPSLRQVLVIAAVFGVEPWYFFDDDYARRADAEATAIRISTVLELDVRAVVARSFAGDRARQVDPQVVGSVIARMTRAFFPEKADQVERLLAVDNRDEDPDRDGPGPAAADPGSP
ncbi:hypothetical protein [Saccharothrix algeriensis]|uniref:Transcriptional regulator with XRE-family HTH domain n=3 Tax=Saccharothrix algeriensis TaxID=173560 RepID=A0ABS2SH69_9PSEU|nr:hypothetical protein [Saccharothrix algeriensis]MBM7814643.1 transcriptional regulator with XRE-family HTH domain [Saccharothrix algeriensis]